MAAWSLCAAKKCEQTTVRLLIFINLLYSYSCGNFSQNWQAECCSEVCTIHLDIWVKNMSEVTTQSLSVAKYAQDSSQYPLSSRHLNVLDRSICWCKKSPLRRGGKNLIWMKQHNLRALFQSVVKTLMTYKIHLKKSMFLRKKISGGNGWQDGDKLAVYPWKYSKTMVWIGLIGRSVGLGCLQQENNWKPNEIEKFCLNQNYSTSDNNPRNQSRGTDECEVISSWRISERHRRRLLERETIPFEGYQYPLYKSCGHLLRRLHAVEPFR